MAQRNATRRWMRTIQTGKLQFFQKTGVTNWRRSNNHGTLKIPIRFIIQVLYIWRHTTRRDVPGCLLSVLQRGRSVRVRVQYRNWFLRECAKHTYVSVDQDRRKKKMIWWCCLWLLTIVDCQISFFVCNPFNLGRLFLSCTRCFFCPDGTLSYNCDNVARGTCIGRNCGDECLASVEFSCTGPSLSTTMVATGIVLSLLFSQWLY